MSSVHRVTIRDVARQAGVSSSTVSQVLNGRAGYASSTTSDRVLEAASQLGYRPNAVARGLVMARTGIIGLVITDITSEFFTQIVGSVEQVASQQQYSVLLACAEGVEPERAALETLLDKRVDGIICMSSTIDATADHVLDVARLGVPLVVINRPLDTAELSLIAWDDVEVGRLATRFLIELGHRRIAHVSGLRDGRGRRSAVDRLVGYRDALTSAGIPLEDALVVDGNFEFHVALDGCSRLFAEPDPPTAVFAANDAMAVAAVSALHRLGLRVPDDVSVVGANDDRFALHVEPQLTTVRLPITTAGRRAAEHILALIGGAPQLAPVTEMLPSELIVRGSTAPPRQQP